ncbi:nuclear transport factor 2 family protein [Flavobacterium sp. ALD4]|uniref:nuclear transport factor 2 family protein n=1 Tax=Flavobacterium sp. ALD4 TaxID=2058314 RepID=UPI001E2F9050|nr:nuclear transport factor 2 family protein [Flavobacterium sp. ALD4]
MTNEWDFFYYIDKANTMTPEKLQSIAFKWFETFNNKELEKLLSLYDDDAEHFSPKLKIHQPETNGLLIGKQALREWWQDAFNRLPSLNYKVKSLTANGDRVFMEYIRTADGEDEMHVAEVLNIREDKIVASRVYHG